MRGAHPKSTSSLSLTALNLRNEAYIKYAAVTKVEAERSRWTFYFAISLSAVHDSQDKSWFVGVGDYYMRGGRFKVEGIS